MQGPPCLARMPSEAERRRGGALDLVTSMPASIASASTSALSALSLASSSSPAAGAARSPNNRNNNSSSSKGRPLSFLISKVTALPLGALIREAWRRRRKTVELSGGAAKAIAARGNKNWILFIFNLLPYRHCLPGAFSWNYDVLGSKTVCWLLCQQKKRI